MLWNKPQGARASMVKRGMQPAGHEFGMLGLELLRDLQQEWLTLCFASSSLLENTVKGKPHFMIVVKKMKTAKE